MRLISKALNKARQVSRRMRAPRRWDGVDTALLVSTGRTGTQFMAKFFQQASRGIDARHEPSPDLFHVSMDFVRGKWDYDRSITEYLWARNHIRREMDRAGVTRYLESNNNASFIIPQILSVAPQTKVIHVTRDPRDFVRSSFSKTTASRHDPSKKALVMSDDDHRRRIAASDYPDDPYHSRWPTMDRFERIAWFWSKVNDVITLGIADHQPTLIIKYEDLFNGDGDIAPMMRVVDFLGWADALTAGPDKIRELMARPANETREFLLSKADAWTPEQIESVRRITGETARRLGYEI